eukprot:5815713-Pleurochrysis_carterae.AAC.1
MAESARPVRLARAPQTRAHRLATAAGEADSALSKVWREATVSAQSAMPRSSQSQATADSPRKLILQLTPLLLEEFALLGKELEEKSSAYDIVPDVAPELRRLAYWVSSNARELIVLGGRRSIDFAPLSLLKTLQQ